MAPQQLTHFPCVAFLGSPLFPRSPIIRLLAQICSHNPCFGAGVVGHDSYAPCLHSPSLLCLVSCLHRACCACIEKLCLHRACCACTELQILFYYSGFHLHYTNSFAPVGALILDIGIPNIVTASFIHIVTVGNFLNNKLRVTGK